jgi:hypothetical protein
MKPKVATFEHASREESQLHITRLVEQVIDLVRKGYNSQIQGNG